MDYIEGGLKLPGHSTEENKLRPKTGKPGNPYLRESLLPKCGLSIEARRSGYEGVEREVWAQCGGYSSNQSLGG